MTEAELKKKREEIQSKVREIASGWYWEDDKTVNMAQDLIDYLASQGVMIVDKEADLPENTYKAPRDSFVKDCAQMELVESGFYKTYPLKEG